MPRSFNARACWKRSPAASARAMKAFSRVSASDHRPSRIRNWPSSQSMSNCTSPSVGCQPPRGFDRGQCVGKTVFAPLNERLEKLLPRPQPCRPGAGRHRRADHWRDFRGSGVGEGGSRRAGSGTSSPTPNRAARSASPRSASVRASLSSPRRAASLATSKVEASWRSTICTPAAPTLRAARRAGQPRFIHAISSIRPRPVAVDFCARDSSAERDAARRALARARAELDPHHCQPP